MLGLYLTLGAFVAGLAMGGYGAWDWQSSRQAAKERDLAEAQAMVDQKATELRAAAAEKINAMQAAYEAGELNAKTVTKTIYVKAQTYAQSTPTLRAPQCNISPDGVQYIASAVSELQRTAAASVLGLAVSSTVYPAAGADVGGGTVPAVSGQSVTPWAVHTELQQLRPAGAGTGSAGEGVRRKPVPIP